jgi:hypothetical protein
MAEYIEREAAYKVLTDYYHHTTEFQHGALLEALYRVPAADVVSGVDFRDCRNELCLRCGEYKTKHLGSCDDCRWR